MNCAGYQLGCTRCLLGQNKSGVLLLHFIMNELWRGNLGSCYVTTHNNIQDRVGHSGDPAWFHTILPKTI